MFKKPEYSELDKSLDVFFLASGGRDSSAMVLEAWDLGIKGVMVWNNTRFNHKNKKVLEQLSDKTGFELIEVTYDGSKKPMQVLKESFLKIPLALERLEMNRFSWRNAFPCCHVFKHGPMNRYFKTLDTSSAVLVLGIKGADGSYVRRWRLSELREQDTFYRRHKNNNLLYYYPLRDLSNKDISAVLSDHKMNNIKGSGCSMCPVFCLFDNMHKSDSDCWLRSVRYAKRLGVDFPGANQTELREFCSGI